jgi:hypothetical protein
MRLKLIVFILLSGLFGYSVYWFYISQNTDLFLEKTHEFLAAHDVTFKYSSYEVSGFPYRLVLVFQNPVFTYQNGPLSFELMAHQMEAIAQPWNFDHFIIFPEEVLLRLGYTFKDQIEVTLKPATIGFSINALGEGSYRLSAEMKEVGITSNLDLKLPAEFSNFSFHLRKEQKPRTDETDLFEPKLLELAFKGNTKTRLSFQINVSFRGQDVPEITFLGLTKWRDQGGTLEVDLLQITDASSSLEGSGSLTLDNELRPLGAISLTGEEWGDILAFFRANNWLDEVGATLVSEYLATLPAPDGGNRLPLALTLQDGSFYLGPARLSDIKPIIQE